MKFLNKDSETVTAYSDFKQYHKAAVQFFLNYNYTPSVFHESKKVKNGTVYALYAIEDPGGDHFYGFIAD